MNGDDDEIRATGRIVGRGPFGNLAVELLDGPHAGSVWYLADHHDPETDVFDVRYYAQDQFVTPIE